MKHLRLALPLVLCLGLCACNSPKKPEKQPGPMDKTDKQITLTDGQSPGAAGTAGAVETTPVTTPVTNPGDEPASLEDIERYYEVLDMREQMKQLSEIMSHQANQMMNEALKAQPELSPQDRERFNALYEKIIKNIPTEELLQSMAPIFAKHFTKNDINTIIAFYASPVGKKMVRETPRITQEAMQASIGTMQNYMKHSMDELYQLLGEFQEEAAQAQSGERGQSGEANNPGNAEHAQPKFSGYQP